MLTVPLLLPSQTTPGGEAARTEKADYRIYTEHPRLFLRPQRLKRLRRERERQSIRWNQFETLVAGKARLAEPGIANALYYQVTGDPAAARTAIQSVLAPNADARETALVFDWCQDALSPAESKALSARLTKFLETSAAATDIPAMRTRVLAAIALGDHVPGVAERTLENTVEVWWRKRAVPGLKGGDPKVFRREDAFPLFELLHAVNDNLTTDLREQAGAFFKQLPAVLLLSYYPATYPAAENHYRIPMFAGTGEPDPDVAARARIADLEIVAYDANALENQFVQGWLMQDRFNLKGPFGAPYEFLWANPYQPGLSPYHMPLFLHDSIFGRVFVRSSWEEDAEWFGYDRGQMQSFSDGKIREWTHRKASDPITLGEVAVLPVEPGAAAARFELVADSVPRYYVAGLLAERTYAVEVDDEEMFERTTDPGGILELEFKKPRACGVRLKAVQ